MRLHIKIGKATKNNGAVAPLERKNVIKTITSQLLFGEITQGQALKALRINITGLKQEQYAQLIKISRKTISDIENDRGNYTVDIINRAFKPFGLRLGIQPTSISTLKEILSKED